MLIFAPAASHPSRLPSSKSPLLTKPVSPPNPGNGEGEGEGEGAGAGFGLTVSLPSDIMTLSNRN